MANREFTNQTYALTKRAVRLAAHVFFGSTGAPTLDTTNSKGILSVTRQSAGIFTFQFGSVSNGVNLLDTYVGLDAVMPSFNIVDAGTASPAAEAFAIYQNQVANGGGGLIAPVQSTPVASSGGGFTSGAYKWVVTAKDSVGNETVASNEQSLSPTSSQQVTISWAASVGAVSYNVYRTLASGAAGSELVFVANTTALSYADQGTAPTAVTPVLATTTYAYHKPPLLLASVTLVFLSTTTPTDPALGESLHVGFNLFDSNAP